MIVLLVFSENILFLEKTIRIIALRLNFVYNYNAKKYIACQSREKQRRATINPTAFSPMGGLICPRKKKKKKKRRATIEI